MNQQQKRARLARDLRRTAPILKRLMRDPGPVPSHVLQALREGLDQHFPEPPPKLDNRITEMMLLLFAEGPKDVDEIVTGLRLQSVRCNQVHVRGLIDELVQIGLLIESLVASVERKLPVYELTQSAWSWIGLADPKAKRIKLKQLVRRTD